MAASVHVVARFVAKPGKEDALKAALATAIAPTRRELGCYQYDLLVSITDPREYAFIERWDGEGALDQHLAAPHVKKMLSDIEALLESPPDIRRYRLA